MVQISILYYMWNLRMDLPVQMMYVKRALRTKFIFYVLCFCETEKSLFSFKFPDCIFLTTYSLLHITTNLYMPMIKRILKILILECVISVLVSWYKYGRVYSTNSNIYDGGFFRENRR